MKIGILFDDAGFQNIDFRYPENGNPGIGGTQFCFLMLIRYYSKINKTDELIVYHLNSMIVINIGKILLLNIRVLRIFHWNVKRIISI